ncbi:spore germination protein (amino acid permease) [Fictibacillus solisalsi]|uniref:Spore germination protein (Amino acid permease) n=1 Tax=Fictibacillus solisalsi TaxID=459525 RepID=A0A1G9TTZ7_9BACL|nr:endospore germination permease [Fictibacillus solisalsi]SDM51031.1 spore germination protein (amino acid permease) [Fictibacillus solisalsi]
MKNSDSITIFQLSLLAITSIGLKCHVFLIQPMIRTAGRDAWLSILITFILTLAWIPLLLFINKKTNGQHLFQWMRERAGRGFTNVILILILCYLTLAESITMRETITFINITFLQETPLLFITVVFGLACLFLAGTSMRTVSVSNIILLFFIVLLGFFVSFTNIQYKDYSLLQPFLEHGLIPVLKATIYQGSGMVELLLLLFLQHKIVHPLKFKHLAILSFLLCGLTIGPLIGSIVEFGPLEGARQRFPAYEEWGLASLGKFVEHVDFLSIYQWLSGTFIRLSVFFYIMKEIIPFKKGQNWFLLIVFAIVTGLTLYPISDFTYSNLMFFTILPLTFWFFLGFSFVLGGFVAYYSKKKRRSKHGVF